MFFVHWKENNKYLFVRKSNVILSLLFPANNNNNIWQEKYGVCWEIFQYNYNNNHSVWANF